MQQNTNSNSLAQFEKHICGIMIVSLFFGERLQFLGVPIYGYLMMAFILVRLWRNHFKIIMNGFHSILNSNGFAWFWLFVATIMLPFSMRAAGTRPYTYALITCLTISIVYLSIDNDEDAEFLMKYAMVGVFATILVTLFELQTGNHLYQFNDYYTRIGRNSAFGFQVNPNDHATVLVTCVFIIIFFLKRHKILSSVLIALIVLLTMRVRARLAIYTLIAIGIEALILLAVSRIAGKRKGASKFLNVFVFIFLGLVVGLSFSVDSFLQLFSSSQDYLIDYNRFILIRRALSTISPLTLLFGRGSGVTMILLGNLNIHSVLVEILCDNGILVLAWLLFFVFRLFFSYTDDIERGKKIIFPCFATAFLLLCFESSSMLRIHPIWMVFAVMWRLYLITLYDKKESADIL